MKEEKGESKTKHNIRKKNTERNVKNSCKC